MTTVSEFKNALGGGGARPNQFRVDLTFPGSVALGALAGANGQFLCKAAQMPGSNLGDIPVAFRGRYIHVAGDREFQGWAITVYNDVDFTIRKAFEQWMNAVNNHTQIGGETQAAMYQVDLNVNQLDKNGSVLKTYKIVDAYPTQLSPIQLDFEQNNQIETFDVDFIYNYWTSDTTS